MGGTPGASGRFPTCIVGRPGSYPSGLLVLGERPTSWRSRTEVLWRGRAAVGSSRLGGARVAGRGLPRVRWCWWFSGCSWRARRATPWAGRSLARRAAGAVGVVPTWRPRNCARTWWCPTSGVRQSCPGRTGAGAWLKRRTSHGLTWWSGASTRSTTSGCGSGTPQDGARSPLRAPGPWASGSVFSRRRSWSWARWSSPAWWWWASRSQRRWRRTRSGAVPRCGRRRGPCRRHVQCRKRAQEETASQAGARRRGLAARAGPRAHRQGARPQVRGHSGAAFGRSQGAQQVCRLVSAQPLARDGCTSRRQEL
jgi:hypothetical protein